MNGNVAAFFSGGLFGTGLIVSGMVRPSKVIGFLDVTGAWDPSLACVMVGAIATYALARRWVSKRSAPIYEPTFELPSRKHIDARLVGGAALFGVGWGLAGLCPGPSLVALGAAVPSAWVFVLGMVVGTVAVHSVVR